MKNFLFIIFFILSFTRPMQLLFYTIGLSSSLPMILTNNMFSPQPYVFFNSVYLKPIFICSKYSSGETSCTTQSAYIKNQLTEPYFLGGVTFSHSTQFMIGLPEISKRLSYTQRALDFLCKKNVIDIEISNEFMDNYSSHSIKNHYHYPCPHD